MRQSQLIDSLQLWPVRLADSCSTLGFGLAMELSTMDCLGKLQHRLRCLWNQIKTYQLSYSTVFPLNRDAFCAPSPHCQGSLVSGSSRACRLLSLHSELLASLQSPSLGAILPASPLRPLACMRLSGVEHHHPGGSKTRKIIRPGISLSMFCCCGLGSRSDISCCSTAASRYKSLVRFHQS
jgi:hypothetical protein